jgi:outer membrane protein assembly factor BamB
MKRSTIAVSLLFAVACGVTPPGPGAAAAERRADAAPLDRSDSDWPQWRGPGRDALSPQTGLLRAWPESGPEIVWRIPAGAGFSGVTVAGGRLYTLWDENGRQFLVSLDAATGREVWRRPLGAAFTHPYGDGPRSTPLVDGRFVFAIGTDGLLLAADARSGDPLWQHDLVREFDASLPSYGFATSPLLTGGKLVVEAGGAAASFIAFDRTTGRVAWQAGGDRPAYSSPIAITIDGATQVVFWSAHGLHALSADRGTALWNYPWESLCPVTGDPLNTATPIFMPPDRIFLSSGSGAAAIRIVLSGNAPRYSVETVWTSGAMRSDVNTSLLFDGHIYGFDRGTLKSLDAGTGEVRWKARGFERGSLIAADGTLIVLGEGGNLALVDATPDAFVQRAAAQVMAGRNWTSPSLAGHRLYLRNHEELVCIDLRG